MSLDAIGIVSKDIARTVEFYELLGVVLQPEGSDEHYEGLTPSGVRIMVDAVELIQKINPDWIEPVGSGVILCFKQESPKEVDAKYECIIKSGFQSVTEPWDAFWGQRYSSVKDPNGNQIDIFADL